MTRPVPDMSAVPVLFEDVACELVDLCRPPAGADRRLTRIKRFMDCVQGPLLLLVRRSENKRAFQFHDISRNNREHVESDDFPSPDVLPSRVQMRSERVETRVTVGVCTGEGTGQERSQGSIHLSHRMGCYF